jgi:hypothetical protein
MSDYTELDTAIIRVVSNGAREQHSICARLSDCARGHIKGSTMTPNFLIDSRLRVLRGAGKLRMDARGFSIPGPEPVVAPATAKVDYANLDAAIVGAIKGGAIRLSTIQVPSVMTAAKAHATPVAPEWRIVDRRLQAMRKKGVLTYSSGAGWQVAAA